MESNKVIYKSVSIDTETIFYRKAGKESSPTILLLHGFPSSSHMFRELIPILAHDYHVIAPDLIGFGESSHRSHKEFEYTFDNLAYYINLFIQQLSLNKFALYVFDYGAPVGFRLAMANPEKITGIISQNGNAYEEGLSEGWNPIMKYWKERTAENRNALLSFLTAETTQWQYTYGVDNVELVSPDGYNSDQFFLNREGSDDIQLDLFGDYKNNVALYPDFQKYFRTYQPPLLAVWGKNDPFFLPEGAEAYKKDIPNALIKLYDTGHFALETHLNEISIEILSFLQNIYRKEF
ncbi:alpha/beta hydrolase [Chryseobacterium sp.]|uniref:alpha/beta fold hydrolase n=1 Tax=Chryseobacterium sp. TaxID=1871047 RepID=UPI0025C1ED2A|nr:alpha/beta hydrolase [Chryseobacterium sp.]